MSGEVRQILWQLVSDACARIPEEPRLHVKVLLAEHAGDDAASLAELGLPDQAPLPLEGDPRPDLIARLRELEAGLDPLTDEPQLAVLIKIRHDQERHLVELPDLGVPPPRSPDPDMEGATEELRMAREIAAAALRRVGGPSPG